MRYLLVLFMLAPFVAHANKAHNQLQSLSEEQRRQALTRLMTNSGEDCKVTRTFFQGTSKSGQAFWNVECWNKKSFVITVNPDQTGTTSLLECKALKLTSGVDCFKKF